VKHGKKDVDATPGTTIPPGYYKIVMVPTLVPDDAVSKDESDTEETDETPEPTSEDEAPEDDSDAVDDDCDCPPRTRRRAPR
jgi:hypothetical protein